MGSTVFSATSFGEYMLLIAVVRLSMKPADKFAPLGVIVLVVVVAMMLFIISAQRKWRIGPGKSIYAPRWHSEAHHGIVAVLGKHKVPKCAKYDYKPSLNSVSVYLIRCRGATTAYYRVTASLNSVLGPFSNEQGASEISQLKNYDHPE